MKVLLFAGWACCSLLLVQGRTLYAVDADDQKLQGKWSVESFDYNATPVEMMKDAIREFKDNKYTLMPKVGDVIEGTFTVDSSQKPKTIDLNVNGRALKGIYELEGDVLKMCYNLNVDQRPSEFVSKPDSGLILVVHKRGK